MAAVLRVILVALVLAAAAPVYAQGEVERDPAAAQTLFEQALQLRDDGNLEEACGKFAESQRLDPQLGTLLNLADCYARTGKTASAWAAFVELEGQARPKGDPRADLAKKRADELKPKLSAMRIEVTEPVEGLEVKRDDVVVGKAQWGEPVPVDPGSHHIRASAPGYKPWEQTVNLDPDGAELEVAIPALEKAPDAGNGGGGKAADADPNSARQGQLIAGIVFTGLGGAGLIVAGALQIVAKTRDDESLDHCGANIGDPNDDPNVCNDTGKALRDEARRLQLGAIVTVVAGGALAATGVILLLTMPDEEDDQDATALRVLPMVGPGYAGVGLTGQW